MRVLIEVLRPAQVHVFRNVIRELESRGHEILVTARDQDITVGLLGAYGLPFRLLSAQKDGPLAGLLDGLVRAQRRIPLIRSFQPDLLVGVASPSLGWSGKVHRVPAALFLDAEPPGRTARRVYRLAHTTVTPASYRGTIRGRHVTYPGYPELAYLHPARFEPDPDRAAGFGVNLATPYTVVRFTSWDTGRTADAETLERRSRMVEALRGRTRVAILADDQALPGPLQADRITGRVADVHHLIAFASLVVADSPRVAAEGAVLGTPAVHLAAGSCGYVDNIAARYQLITHLQPHAVEAAVDTFERYLAADGGEWASARARLLDEQTDVTAWMADFFERFTKG